MRKWLWITALAGAMLVLASCRLPNAGTEQVSDVMPRPTEEGGTPVRPSSPTAESTPIRPMAVPSATPVVIPTQSDVQRIAPAGAKALMDEDSANLYDVRSAEEYRIQHAAGALSLPDSEVAARVGELADDRALIFY